MSNVLNVGDIVVIENCNEDKIGRIAGISYPWDCNEEGDLIGNSILYSVDVSGETYYRLRSEIKRWNNKQSYGN